MTSNLDSSILGEGNAEDERDIKGVFIKTDDYGQIIDKRKQIIIGERGVGKSAIFRMLEANADSSSFIVSLIPDDISWAKLEKVSKRYSGNIPAIAKQWEFALLLECFETISKNIPANERRKKIIKDFGSEIKRTIDISLFEVSSSKRFSIIVDTALNILQNLPFKIELKTPGGGLSVKNWDKSETGEINKEHLPIYQDQLIERTYSVLSELLPKGRQVHILIDQLDDHWKGKKNQIDSLCGLFSATTNIRENLLEKNLENRLELAIFIRSDIYEHLKRNGLDHVSKYTSYEHYLRWDEKSLIKMIDKRLVLSGTFSGGMKNLFNSEKILNKNLRDYILTTIFPRPRDLIRFLSFCIDRSVSMGHKKIQKDDVIHSEPDYSNWRLTVIHEEARYEYQYSEQLLESFIGKYSIFSLSELKSHLDEFKRENEISTRDKESTKPALIKKLISWGIIGVKEKSKTTFIWNTTVRGHLLPANGNDVVIHPALWASLGIKKGRRRKPSTKSKL